MQCVVTEHEAPQSTELRSLAIAHGLLDFIASGGSEQRSSSVENGSKMRHLLCVRNNQKWSSSGGSARSEAPEREKVAPSLGAGASAQAAGSSELAERAHIASGASAAPPRMPQAKWGKMCVAPGKVGTLLCPR